MTTVKVIPEEGSITLSEFLKPSNSGVIIQK
jgi:hypothetical protein